MSAKLTSDNYLTAVLSPVGDQWKKMRKIIVSKVLSPAMHKFLHHKRTEEADHLVKYVYNQCCQTNHGLVNVRFAARYYCGNVIRKLVFGKRFLGTGMEDGGPGIEEKEHIDGIFTILCHLYGFAIADFVPWLEVFDFDGYKKILSDAINDMRKYQDPEINKRVEMWQRGIRKTEEDILDVLINLKDSKNNPLLSIQEIKAQITVKMINQPNILDKVCKELDRVVGKDRLVEESDLPKLNYVKACVKESFRLHRMSPFNVPHVSTKDTIVGGYFVPKGSHMLLSRPGLGRNLRVWEDPLRYKPERHIVDDASEVVLIDHELRMLSFSVGRRGCPGVTLGSTMATVLLARLIQGFNWMTPLDGQRIDLIPVGSSIGMDKVTESFMQQFSINKRCPKTIVHLFQIKQKEAESLHDFMKCFVEESLAGKPPTTLEELLKQAAKHIRVEKATKLEPSQQQINVLTHVLSSRLVIPVGKDPSLVFSCEAPSTASEDAPIYVPKCGDP
ncbi:hypothetical protein DH2020_043592 [Rehmannia glutinosa]|uniref:Uncharacterized protein n=1 Tax=Rehmannia glutinosa TaxID=99300 RepID=A0ABR0UJ70_REHGL